MTNVRALGGRHCMAALRHATVEVEIGEACPDEISIETRKRTWNGKAGR
jgi:hypothetical protein